MLSLQTALDVLGRLEGAPAKPVLIRRSAEANTTIVATRSLVLRVGQAWPLAPGIEARCCAAARAVGVPAPEVLEVGVVAGRPYMVYRRLGGHQPRTTLLADESAAVLARLHTADYREFPADQHCRPRRRHRFLLARRGLTQLADPSVRATAARSLAAAEEDWERRDVAAHGDFRWPNLLARGTVIVGVLDWTDVRQASRESDLGNVELNELGPLVAAYQRVAGTEIDRSLVAGYVFARHLALTACGVLTAGAADRAVRHVAALWPAAVRALSSVR
jgi:aminoglycoside phosphotransferase (APT) family kinase protein